MSHFLGGKPYKGETHSYNGFDKLYASNHLLTKAECKDIGFPVEEGEEPVAYYYYRASGSSGYVPLYKRTDEIKDLYIEKSKLKIHEMTSDVYTALGIRRYRKTMSLVGITKDGKYKNVRDVSNEPEMIKAEEYLSKAITNVEFNVETNFIKFRLDGFPLRLLFDKNEQYYATHLRHEENNQNCSYCEYMQKLHHPSKIGSGCKLSVFKEQLFLRVKEDSSCRLFFLLT